MSAAKLQYEPIWRSALQQFGQPPPRGSAAANGQAASQQRPPEQLSAEVLQALQSKPVAQLVAERIAAEKLGRGLLDVTGGMAGALAALLEAALDGQPLPQSMVNYLCDLLASWNAQLLQILGPECEGVVKPGSPLARKIQSRRR